MDKYQEFVNKEEPREPEIVEIHFGIVKPHMFGVQFTCPACSSPEFILGTFDNNSRVGTTHTSIPDIYYIGQRCPDCGQVLDWRRALNYETEIQHEWK